MSGYHRQNARSPLPRLAVAQPFHRADILKPVSRALGCRSCQTLGSAKSKLRREFECLSVAPASLRFPASLAQPRRGSSASIRVALHTGALVRSLGQCFLAQMFRRGRPSAGGRLTFVSTREGSASPSVPGRPSCGGQLTTASRQRSVRHSASATSWQLSSSRPTACSGWSAQAHLSTMRGFAHAKNRRSLVATGVRFFAGRARQPNPSIERTFQRLLRTLWPAAHVER